MGKVSRPAPTSAPKRAHAARRGEMVDIGGRRLRMVRAGPDDASPTIVLEHGAFGCAADWAEVQRRLAAKGLKSLAYDRAGLGLSDPGPPPRDGSALAHDLERLLAAADETGPFVVVGHSMGGLMVRIFAHRNPGAVLGVVLVDAVTPQVWDLRMAPSILGVYHAGLRAAGVGARAGLMRPVALMFGNLIGLTGEAAVEKRRIYGSASHARWAAEEVGRWAEISALAGEHDFDPDLPIAVVTAGRESAWPQLKALQAAPALACRHGYVEHVAGAHHASLLGVRFADPVVRGVEHVLKAAGRA